MDSKVKINKIRNNTSQGQNLNSFFIKNFKQVVIVLCLALFLTCGWFVLWPKYQKINYLANIKYQQRQENLKTHQTEYEKIVRLIEDYQKIKPDDRNKMLALLPAKIEFQDVLLEFDRLASQHGMVLVSIKIATEAKPSGAETNQALFINVGNYNLVKIRINISLTGSNYNNLRSFIAAAEKNLPLIDINSISYNPDDNSTSMEVFTYAVK